MSSPDMADAHETARARDARGTDFHREWLHVMDTQHPHTPQENDMPNNQRRHREQMGVLDQIHDTLTEIRDRLPEREVACGDVWRDETERPCTRPSGHDGNHVDKAGTIWANPEPAPVPRPEPADTPEEPPVGSRFMDCHGHVWRRGERGWGIEGLILGSNFDNPWSTVQQYAPLRPTTDEDRKRVGLPVEPAPADVDPDEAGGEGGPEVKRLREGIAEALDLARLLPEQLECGGNSCHCTACDLVCELGNLLNPPTEGETDHE